MAALEASGGRTTGGMRSLTGGAVDRMQAGEVFSGGFRPLVQVMTVEQDLKPSTLTVKERLLCIFNDGERLGAFELGSNMRFLIEDGALHPFAVLEIRHFVKPPSYASNLTIVDSTNYVYDAGVVLGSPHGSGSPQRVLEQARRAHFEFVETPIGLSSGVLGRILVENEQPIHEPILQVVEIYKPGEDGMGIVVSDGVHVVNARLTQSEVELRRKHLTKLCLIRVKNWIVEQCVSAQRRLLVILLHDIEARPDVLVGPKAQSISQERMNARWKRCFHIAPAKDALPVTVAPVTALAPVRRQPLSPAEVPPSSPQSSARSAPLSRGSGSKRPPWLPDVPTTYDPTPSPALLPPPPPMVLHTPRAPLLPPVPPPLPPRRTIAQKKSHGLRRA